MTPLEVLNAPATKPTVPTTATAPVGPAAQGNEEPVGWPAVDASPAQESPGAASEPQAPDKRTAVVPAEMSTGDISASAKPESATTDVAYTSTAGGEAGSIEIASAVDGTRFRLCREGAHKVRCDVQQGERWLTSFSLPTVSEKTISFRLASLAIAYPTVVHRDLDSARLASNARLLVAENSTHSTYADPQKAAAGMLDSPNLVHQIRDHIVKLGFRADPDVGVALYLAKLSALTDEPLYVYMVGPASSLKTSYADATARLMPPEFCKHLTELTKKALYYGHPELAHFGVFLDELDLKGGDLAVDLKVLREMYSKGWCEIEVTLGGKAVRRHIRGPVFVVQTTTALDFDEQDVSRRLVIELPDIPERTDKVLTMMGEKYSGQSAGDSTEFLVETHRSLHRMLPAGCEVTIPYALAISRLLPRKHMTVLRSFRTLVSLIKASALLHIRHREMDEDNRLIATLDDYRLVYEVAGTFIAQSLNTSGMSPPVQRWVESLIESLATRAMQKAEACEPHELVGLERMGREVFLADRRRWDEWLSIADLEQITGRPRATIQRYLTQLEQSGLLDQQKAERKITYRLATPGAQLPTCPGLPVPEEVERGHLGISSKFFVKGGFECPAANGQLKEDTHD